jgi:HK97 family phage major capsid protein
MMPTLMEERATALKSAEDIVNGAKASGRELTTDETKKANDFLAAVDDYDGKIKAAQDSQALIKRLGDTGRQILDEHGDGSQGDAPAKTLGEHFIKHAGQRLKEIKGTPGASASAPEWLGYKAATDNQVTNGGIFAPVLTEVDRTIVHGNRTRLTVADLLSSGTLSGNAVTYFVEAAVEGAFTTVAEAAAKPQLHIVDPTTVTDALKKIAAFIKFTDEMTEDLDYYVSEINNRLIYLLGIFEEQQILNGSGSGTNVTGLLNRSGIQTETGATILDNADAVFRSMTKVFTGSGLNADGIVMHPTDYQTFRLKKDANNQYYGGGFFSGEYGNGGIVAQPPMWGLKTVVTPAIAAGTVLVGAFKQAVTLYRKGGVRVESTNSHASDFTSNLVTTRVEERIALACRVPAGLVKLTLGTT